MYMGHPDKELLMVRAGGRDSGFTVVRADVSYSSLCARPPLQ